MRQFAAASIGYAFATPSSPEGSAIHITRNSVETAAGPGEWFTGTVYIAASSTR